MESRGVACSGSHSSLGHSWVSAWVVLYPSLSPIMLSPYKLAHLIFLILPTLHLYSRRPRLRLDAVQSGEKAPLAGILGRGL